jgi:branched-chain amino acid transport system ATP-binding protein
MVAIARALASEPRLLLFDEISLGLAPIAIGQLYSALPAIKSSGASLIVVEQDVSRALAVADWPIVSRKVASPSAGPRTN